MSIFDKELEQEIYYSSMTAIIQEYPFAEVAFDRSNAFILVGDNRGAAGDDSSYLLVRIHGPKLCIYEANSPQNTNFPKTFISLSDTDYLEKLISLVGEWLKHTSLANTEETTFAGEDFDFYLAQSEYNKSFFVLRPKIKNPKKHRRKKKR